MLSPQFSASLYSMFDRAKCKAIFNVDGFFHAHTLHVDVDVLFFFFSIFLLAIGYRGGYGPTYSKTTITPVNPIKRCPKTTDE